MLCRCVSERAGVEVLRGIKLCGLLEVSLEGNLGGLFSSRRRSKLLVDLAGLRDDKLRDGEGVTGEEDGRRLLSLTLEIPVKKKTNKVSRRTQHERSNIPLTADL